MSLYTSSSARAAEVSKGNVQRTDAKTVSSAREVSCCMSVSLVTRHRLTTMVHMVGRLENHRGGDVP